MDLRVAETEKWTLLIVATEIKLWRLSEQPFASGCYSKSSSQSAGRSR